MRGYIVCQCWNMRGPKKEKKLVTKIRRILIFRDRSLQRFEIISEVRDPERISEVARHRRRALTPLVNRTCPHLEIRTLTRLKAPWCERGIGWIRKNSPESTTPRGLSSKHHSPIYALSLFTVNLLLSFLYRFPLPEVKPIEKHGEEDREEGRSFHEEGGVSQRSSYTHTHARPACVSRDANCILFLRVSCQKAGSSRSGQTLGGSSVDLQGRDSSLVYLGAKPSELIDRNKVLIPWYIRVFSHVSSFPLSIVIFSCPSLTG